MSEIDTPRCDATLGSYREGQFYEANDFHKALVFARSLERELAVAREALEKIRDLRIIPGGEVHVAGNALTRLDSMAQQK